MIPQGQLLPAWDFLAFVVSGVSESHHDEVSRVHPAKTDRTLAMWRDCSAEE